MAKDIFWTTVTFSIILMVLILSCWPSNKTEVVVRYDCRMLIGGWHPDVSIDIQKKCRARMNK